MENLETESKRMLQEATPEELAGARRVWGRHRQHLRGKSSVSGAALPEWEGLSPVQQAAHLEMYREARSQ